MEFFEKLKNRMSLNEFLGVTEDEIKWNYLLNFGLAAFLVSALSIFFKEKDEFQTFIMTVINGALMIGGIILTVRYLKIKDVYLMALVIGFICSLASLIYLNFNLIGFSLLTFLLVVTGHFLTFVLLHLFLQNLNYLFAVLSAFVAKGIVFGLLRALIYGNINFISAEIILYIVIYSIAVTVFMLLGATLFKIKY